MVSKKSLFEQKRSIRVHIAQLNHQIVMFFGHNVLMNCSELVSVRMERKISMSFQLELLHLILCEEMTQIQGKNLLFFSFEVITSP